MGILGACMHIYVPEICNDTQCGFAFTMHYVSGIEVTATTEWLVYQLKPEGTFILYSVINFLLFIFFFKNMKESQGLTDKEKK